MDDVLKEWGMMEQLKINFYCQYAVLSFLCGAKGWVWVYGT
jgi:hypothetical protein